MCDEEREVRAAVRAYVGNNKDEVERLLARYVGHHRSVRGFFRRWFEERLGEQADWMLAYINIALITDAAIAMRRVITLPARSRKKQGGVYVFLYKP